MTLTAGRNQTRIHQILDVSWNSRLRNINITHVYGIIRYPRELWCTFYENILPNKGKHLTKVHWKIVYFTCFLTGRAQETTFRRRHFHMYWHFRYWKLRFLAATKQLYEWYFPSVCPSVRLSVCPSVTPFWLCFHRRIITKFSGVITNDKSDVHAKGQGQRSKVKVTEVTTQLNRFRTVTPVWINIWWWNDAYSLMLLRRGALLFLKVIRQISRSHGSKNRRIWPRLGVSGL